MDIPVVYICKFYVTNILHRKQKYLYTDGKL
jgi:hypothetical protein